MRRRYIGNDMTRASARHAVQATGIKTPIPKATHRGNLAGLKDSKSVHLQHNQGGYANPNVQRARFASKELETPMSTPFRSPITANSDRILDKRMVHGKGSLSKLMKLIK